MIVETLVALILLSFPWRLAPLFIWPLVLILSDIILLALLLRLGFLLLAGILHWFLDFFSWVDLLDSSICCLLFFSFGFLLLHRVRLLVILLLEFHAVHDALLLLPDDVDISLTILVQETAAPLGGSLSSKLECSQFFCAHRFLLLEVKVRAGGLRAS